MRANLSTGYYWILLANVSVTCSCDRIKWKNCDHTIFLNLGGFLGGMITSCQSAIPLLSCNLSTEDSLLGLALGIARNAYIKRWGSFMIAFRLANLTGRSCMPFGRVSGGCVSALYHNWRMLG